MFDHQQMSPFDRNILISAGLTLSIRTDMMNSKSANLFNAYIYIIYTIMILI